MLDGTFQAAYPLARRAAQVRATAAVRSGAVPSFDCEDLEQEGLTACWRALPHYDPNRAALRTFVEVVVAARFASLGRARRCRPRLQPLGYDQYRAADGWARGIELRSDVQRVLDGLPADDRQLALALIEHTPTEASGLIGIARSTVYERIRNIRVAFVEAGFRPQGAHTS